MHGSFWVSAFRDSHITTALIISCVFMQKQEKLVSHLNNNEFVHNDNKSLFLAKKPENYPPNQKNGLMDGK